MRKPHTFLWQYFYLQHIEHEGKIKTISPLCSGIRAHSYFSQLFCIQLNYAWPQLRLLNTSSCWENITATLLDFWLIWNLFVQIQHTHICGFIDYTNRDLFLQKQLELMVAFSYIVMFVLHTCSCDDVWASAIPSRLSLNTIRSTHPSQTI